MGRPSLYTPELAEKICDRLAAGETLRAICRDADMPHEATIRGWARDAEHPVSTQYATAREIGYQGMGDEILEIADGSGDARLQVDSRKWLMSKALPKIYGDKQTVDHNVNVTFGDALDAIRARQKKIADAP